MFLIKHEVIIFYQPPCGEVRNCAIKKNNNFEKINHLAVWGTVQHWWMSLGGAPQCSSLPREQSESCSIWKGFSLFVCLFVYFFVCLFISLFVCLFVCLFVYFFVCLFLCLFVYFFVCAPESVECFLRDIVFADGVLEADVEAVLLVYHMEARVLIIIDCKVWFSKLWRR